jgi:RNA polymerase sigma-70 factor (ECF subfamily)
MRDFPGQGSIRVVGSLRNRSVRGIAFHALSFDGKPGSKSRKTDLRKPEVTLREDNRLNRYEETLMANDEMDSGVAEVIVGSAALSNLPTPLVTAPWEIEDAIRSESPRVWESPNAPTGWVAAGEPTSRKRRVPAVRAPHAEPTGMKAAEIDAASQLPGKTAPQPDQFTKPRPSDSAMNFERAYRMYRKRVYTKCLHMVRNEAEAEDLTQEVFLQLFRKMDSFRGESAFSTWLYRVAVNVVLMHLRRKSLATNPLQEICEGREGVFNLEQLLGAPDRALTSAIDRLNLERAVAQMPAGYKQVFLMHYVEGYGHREIAQLLGLAIGTSKSQMYKARVRLRQLLRGEESEQRQAAVSSGPQHVPQRAGRRRRRSRRPRYARLCGQAEKAPAFAA